MNKEIIRILLRTVGEKKVCDVLGEINTALDLARAEEHAMLLRKQIKELKTIQKT